jgi:hypothetical protein
VEPIELSKPLGIATKSSSEPVNTSICTSEPQAFVAEGCMCLRNGLRLRIAQGSGMKQSPAENEEGHIVLLMDSGFHLAHCSRYSVAGFKRSVNDPDCIWDTETE